MFAVLKHWHPMFGRDMHIPWPPASPAPTPPPMPYLTFSLLFGNTAGLTTQSYFTKHLTGGAGIIMSTGTDIGPFIAHFGPPSITLPIEWVASSSKSYFGASTYLGFDNKGVQNSIAVALGIFINPNLNCGTPIPLPVGMVIAANTHCAAMTLGDFLGGIFNMFVETALQVAVNAFVGLGGKVATSIAERLGYRYFATKAAAKAFLREVGLTKGNIINAEARRLLAASSPGSRLVGPLATAVVGFFFGAPTGVDAGSVGGKTAYGAAHDYFDPPTEGTPDSPPATPTYGDYFGSSEGDSPGTEAAPSDGGLPPGGVPDEAAGGAGNGPDAGIDAPAAGDGGAPSGDGGAPVGDAGAPDASIAPPGVSTPSSDASAADAGPRLPDGGGGAPGGGSNDPDGGTR